LSQKKKRKRERALLKEELAGEGRTRFLLMPSKSIRRPLDKAYSPRWGMLIEKREEEKMDKEGEKKRHFKKELKLKALGDGEAAH